MAIKWQMRSDNPCKGIERNQEYKRRRYLSGEELGHLTLALANDKDQQAADLIRMLLLTGARRGEVLAAKWDDIDLVAGTWKQARCNHQTKNRASGSTECRCANTALRSARALADERDMAVPAVTASPARTFAMRGRRFVWPPRSRALARMI